MFDKDWNEVHQRRVWGQWPVTEMVRWVMKTYGGLKSSDLNFLDLGCGAGATLRFLWEEGFNFRAIDGSGMACLRAAELLARIGCKTSESRLTCGDMSVAVPHFVGEFNAVIDVCSTQCLNPHDFAVTLTHIHGYLVPGGKVFSMTAANRMDRNLHGGLYVRPTLIGDLSSAYRDAGFINIKISEHRNISTEEKRWHYILEAQK